jgi:hypothetical protein
MKRLYFKVHGVHEGVSREWVLPELTFGEYVRLTRRAFEESAKNEVEMGILSSGTLISAKTTLTLQFLVCFAR